MKNKKPWPITIICLISAYAAISPWMVYFWGMKLVFITLTDKHLKFYLFKVPVEYAELTTGLLVILGLIFIILIVFKWINYLTKKI